jgi:hypothetical protein
MRFTVFHDTVVSVQTTDDGPSRKSAYVGRRSWRWRRCDDRPDSLSERFSSCTRKGRNVGEDFRFRPMSGICAHDAHRGVIPTALDVAYMMTHLRVVSAQ